MISTLRRRDEAGVERIRAGEDALDGVAHAEVLRELLPRAERCVLAPLDGSEERGDVERPLRDARRELQRERRRVVGIQTLPGEPRERVPDLAGQSRALLASTPRHRECVFREALTGRSLVVADSSRHIKSKPPLTANCANPAARSATPAAIATHTTLLKPHAPPRPNPAPPTDANLSPSARPASTASAGVFGLALTSGDVGREPQSNRLLRPPSSGASSRASGSSTGRDLDVMARG